MKRLLIFISVTLLSLGAFAQSGTGTVDATKLVTVTGGDGTGTIASILWTPVQPLPGTIVLSATNKLVFTVTIDKAGDYPLSLRVTDNLGNIATATFHVIGYYTQRINIDGSNSKILEITIKNP